MEVFVKASRLSLLLAFAILLSGPAALSSGTSGRIVPAGEPIAGSYIITLQPGVDVGDVVDPALIRLRFRYTRALNGFAARMPAAVAEAIARNPLVERVEQDGVVRAVATQSNPPYGLDRIDQRDLPLSGTYVYNATGAGVRAYIIDTGIRTTHQDFGSRASSGYDAIDGGAADDCNGHGTHVAGTVGGATYGVAKSVSLIAVRVLDCGGSGSTSGVIAGVDWVTANKILPAVANMSLGGGASTSLDTAVQNSINAGITYAIAAGNGNIIGLAENACNTSPARVAAALTVSATNASDAKASFANYGSCVDLFAPGVDVTSAWNSSNTATNTISGTSMASPHVAGAAALYLQGNAGATPATVASALNTNATTGKVSNPGSGSPNRLLYTGFIGGGGGGNAAPVANFTSACSGLTCSFTDTSTDADGTIASRSWAFGDGGTSTATNPSRTYAASGTYNVTLTVTDNGGATASTTKSVTVSSGGDPDPSTPTLTNGVTRAATSGASGTWQYFKIQVPSGRPSLKADLAASQSCSLLGCNPDLDVFVRRAAKPTTSTFNCSGETGRSTESCSVSNPAADWWYVGVYVYSGSSALNYTIKLTY